MSDQATPADGGGVRVRFAPSPTGFLHVGSARTALFNWIFARATGGTFVLRIEDTDGDRNRPELIEVIFGELEWLGLDWDEGPFFQSERRDRHREVVEELLTSERAYMVDADNNAVGGSTIADGAAVRYRMPAGKNIVVNDAVRGDVEFSSDELEDFVIWRSNGSPTFLLANAVDDADMGITHAIRGEDLLSTTPKVVLLLDEIGAPRPVYGHLPLLVNEQRKKLSKRRDDVSIADYRSRGYLPEAMANYLALLGWGPRDDVEIRPMSEIIDHFDLADVNKAAAFFDIKKLDHFNSTYIQQLSADDFVDASAPFLADDLVPWNPEQFDADAFAAAASEVQPRAKTLDDVANWVDWLFVDEVTFDEKSWKKGIVKAKKAPEVLAGVVAAFESCDWEADTLEAAVRQVGDDLEVRSAVPVRVAITGKSGGIPLWDPLVRLGRERTLARLRAAIDRLSAAGDSA